MNWLLFVAAFCLYWLVISDYTLAATPQPPVHRLRISFDIATSRLIGSSIIEIPANTETEVFIEDISPTDIILDGKPITLAPDQTSLNISSKTTTQNITLEYTKNIPENAGANGSTISARGITLSGIWYPTLAEDVFFELTATVPPDFDAVSEADSIESTTTPSGRELRFLFPRSLPALTFIAGPYVVEKKKFGTNKDIYSYFFAEDQELASSYLDKAKNYLERYEKLIGPYPYQRFSVIENRLPSGFAVPTMTLLGQTVVRLPFITDTSLGHEALHIWFGNNVSISPGCGNWAEGLTTYMADHLYARDGGKDREFRKNEIIKYMSYVNNSTTVPLKSFTGAFGISAEQQALRAVGYSKCSMLFHMLYKKLGNEIFNKAIQEFYQRMSGKDANWDNIILSFETASNQNLHDFFAQWLERTDIPHLKTRNIKAEERDGSPVLSFIIIQQNEKPFKLTVPITVQTLQGEVRASVNITEIETPVEIPLPASPLRFVIDPDYDLMRQLDNDEIPPVWSGFLGDRDTLAVVTPGSQAEIFAPLLNFLSNMGTTIAGPDEISDNEIAQNSVIFLDTSLPNARALFAEPNHPQTGVTLDIRRNPLNQNHLGILVSAATPEEVTAIVGKLQHYGKYSYLHFEQGKLLERRTIETTNGQLQELIPEPVGIETKQSLSFTDIIEKIAGKRVIYVGEEHTRFEDHQLQLNVIRAMYTKNPKLAIGMEMFSKTDQQILDDFVADKMDEKTFLRTSNYFEKWGYDYRNYRDILNFARLNKIPVIALNLNKEIVSKVYKENGIDSLTPLEKEAIPANRDLDMPGYQDRIADVYKSHKSPQEPDRFKAFLQSQTLWDETMAETIAAFLSTHQDFRMVVVAGQGHVVKNDAIPPRVARRVSVDQAILVNAADKEIDTSLADFLIFLKPVELPPATLLGVMLKDNKGIVTVDKVAMHGSAKRAGIEEKDIILSLDDQTVTGVNDIRLVLFYKQNGDSVSVRIKRPRTFLPDKEMVIEVKL